MEINEVKDLYLKVLANVSEVIVGKKDIFTLIFVSMLAGGHVLIEDNPGTGKTLLAKTLAKSIDVRFKRVQFTPDLMPQDITGLNVYSNKDMEFHLIKGPVFTNILLADEINRATPRTQSSLLEAMEEKHVTIDGETLKLDEPFIVIATDNPIETIGTYPLPEAQLDRFIMKLSSGNLEEDDEISIIKRFIKNSPFENVKPCVKGEDIINAREAVKNVFVHEEIMKYVIAISEATRNSKKISCGVSPRATLMLIKASQAFAAVSGRKYVTPDDVRYLAPYVYAHRIVTFSRDYKDQMGLINEVLSDVKVPVEDWQE